MQAAVIASALVATVEGVLGLLPRFVNTKKLLNRAAGLLNKMVTNRHVGWVSMSAVIGNYLVVYCHSSGPALPRDRVPTSISQSFSMDKYGPPGIYLCLTLMAILLRCKQFFQIQTSGVKKTASDPSGLVLQALLSVLKALVVFNIFTLNTSVAEASMLWSHSIWVVVLMTMSIAGEAAYYDIAESENPWTSFKWDARCLLYSGLAFLTLSHMAETSADDGAPRRPWLNYAGIFAEILTLYFTLSMPKPLKAL